METKAVQLLLPSPIFHKIVELMMYAQHVAICMERDYKTNTVEYTQYTA